MAAGDLRNAAPHYRFSVPNGTSGDWAVGDFVESGGSVFRVLVAAVSGATAVCEGPACGPVFQVTAQTDAAWVVGDIIYRNSTTGTFTTTSGGAVKAGIAAEAKTTSSSTGYVALTQ